MKIDTSKIDVAAVFLGFCACVGDVQKVSLMFDLDPALVEQLAIENEWVDKIKRLSPVSRVSRCNGVCACRQTLFLALEMKTVFIYALCEPGTRTVRYIGKTRNITKRLKQHLYTSAKKDNYLGNWLRSLTAPPTMITLSVVSISDGCSEEILFIENARMLGLKLVNATKGGDGVNMTIEARLKWRASTRSHWEDPEAHSRASALHSTPEALAKHSAAALAQFSTPEARLKHSEACSTPTARKNRSDATTARFASAEARAKHKAKMSSPETRAKLSAAAKAQFSSPDALAAMSARAKATWAAPGFREKLAANKAKQ